MTDAELKTRAVAKLHGFTVVLLSYHPNEIYPWSQKTTGFLGQGDVVRIRGPIAHLQCKSWEEALEYLCDDKRINAIKMP